MFLHKRYLWICRDGVSRGRAWVVCLGLMSGLGGCMEPDQPACTPIDQAWERPAPPTPALAAALPEDDGVVSASRPAGENGMNPDAAESVVAVVNGKAIGRKQLIGMLVESHGLDLLEQMILLTAAQSRAAEMGLTVASEDIKVAHEDALRRIAAPIGSEAAPLDREAAERLLSEFLQAKNISRSQWDLRMRQQAFVRKIAEADVTRMTVTGPMLREEYALAYGERVQVRHIQVSSLAAVERARAALETMKDFAAVAREVSENQITAASGGLMPPFTRNAGDVPPLIRETAFRLKPGEVSQAVQQDNWYHLLKWERHFPASGVSFENVDREELKKRLVDRLVRQRQETLEEDLFRSANIDIRDDILKKQFREKYRR